MDVPTAVTESLKIGLPALFTFLASYFAFRWQLKTKALEIESQASIKAKELIFSAYQKRWEKAEHEAAELTQRAHEIFDKQMRGDYQDLAVLFSQLIAKQALGLYQEEFEHLLDELKDAGILEQHIAKIRLVQTRLKVDIKSLISNDKSQEIKAQEMYEHMQGVAMAAATIAILHGHLMQKKAEDLFGGHLKPATLSKKPKWYFPWLR